MQVFRYRDVRFARTEEGVRATFHKHFYFDFRLPEGAEIRGGCLHISGPAGKAEKAALRILEQGLLSLRSVFGRRAYYIHSPPLIGCRYFGLIDRNTNLIEIRPATGCNLNCIYCSVGEGTENKLVADYIVSSDAILGEFAKLAAFKDTDIEAHINPQGEPLLYAPLCELIHGLSSIRQVRRVSLNTNGTLLTEKRILNMAKSGLGQINISINAACSRTASRMAGCSYNAAHVQKMAVFAAGHMKVILSPLLLPGINEKGIRQIVAFAKKHSLGIGIQNFMAYRSGRNPVRPMPMDRFRWLLGELEREKGVRLLLDAESFGVHPTARTPVPLRKGEKVACTPVCPGRLEGETICTARGRLIHVRPFTGRAVTITRTKHNIIYGK